MVIPLSRKIIPIITVIIVVVLLASIPQSVRSLSPSKVSAIQYHIDKEWVVIWINTDGSIELHYNITITYGTSAQGYMTIGLPAKGFQIYSVKDLSGTTLSYTDQSSGSYYAVEVYFGHAMSAGSSGTVLLIATVPNMLSPDSMNSGYMGMQFTPTYFTDATVNDLRVAIVPPQGVTKDTIKTSSTAYLTTVDGAFAVYWEQYNLAPGTQLTYGVSVPQQYIQLPGPDIWFYLTIALIIVAIVIVLVLLYRRLRKAVYEKPKVSIEALGAARGLTAVEAAVVLELKPVRVLTMTLFGLLLKRFVTVKETGPPIKLEMTDAAKNRNASSTPVRYYEIDFLKAIQNNGVLDEELLARTYLSLRDNVDRKMRGYSRVDTVNYYKSIVEEGWKQVTQAGTPELKGDAIEQNIEWLLADEHYDQRFKQAFPPDLIFVPRPSWYWYWPWHGPYYPGRGIPPTPGPTPSPTEIKPIPAQEWANNLVRGMESMSNNIVKNVQDFSNRLVGAPAAQSSRPVHSGSSCVCACAHCACACACVGCACACAHGGAR